MNLTLVLVRLPIYADEDDDYPGTAFPYLSSNLDFSTDEELAPLVVEDREASEIPNINRSNRIFGDAGDDSIFTTSGGDNLIIGGEGADQFSIASAAIPESTNMVDDFTAGQDVIGIAGLGVSFDEVSLIQQDNNTLISAGGEDLATLMGINADDLSADNFAFA